MSEYAKAVGIVDTYIQAMTDGDYDRVMTLYADDATLEDPVGSEVKHGKEAISEFYHSIGDTKLVCTRTGPVRYAGREIVFPFECVMQTDDGTLKMEIIDHFVLNDDDQISAMRAFWGPETASMQGIL